MIHWKPNAVALIILLAAVGITVAAPSAPDIFPGEVLVKFRTQITPQTINRHPSTGLASVDGLLASTPPLSITRDLKGVKNGNAYGLDRVWSLKFTPSVDVMALVKALSGESHVEYAEPRYIRHINAMSNRATFPIVAGGDEIPNDPFFNLEWGLTTIQAPQAWDVTHGDTSVVIAIVDLGTQCNHPDLQANIWNNWAELNGQAGVDDDSDGCVDDFYGWDFIGNDGYPDPNPGDDHGSHTAGTASAVTNNGVGVAGVGYNCKIMPVRAGYGDAIYYGIEGINYASLAGARVISCSFGGGGASTFEQDVINDATDRGSLVIASAGNENTQAPSYPAAYDHVISVAATAQSDARAGYSNYGTWVDCSAPGGWFIPYPGGQIYSTIINGYGWMSGTSMSCPHVAGLAGLVASVHPSWTPAQIEAQILSTCDNIDAQNPGYVGLLGAGRINAHRAVTENSPYVIVTDQGFEDGNNNGIIEPGEAVQFWVELTDELQPVTSVQVVVSTADPYVTLTQPEAAFGDLGTGQSANNQTSQFAFTVASNAPGSHQITFDLHITGGGGYSVIRQVYLTILPIYGDHNVGNVVLTITNFGAVGYVPEGSTTPVGSGFQYPPGSGSALYHGSVMVGTSATRVSDNSYGNSAYDHYDFATVPGGNLVIQPGTTADQEGFAIFADRAAPTPLGVQVAQHSYAWANAPDNDYVIMRYTVTNLNDTTLHGAFVAVYLDWDIGANPSTNTAGWDPDSAVGYMQGGNSPLYGVCLVSGPASSFRAVNNPQVLYTNLFTDSTKYWYMHEGFDSTQGTNPNDWSMQISAGPFDIEGGQDQTVAFAVLGGDNLRDLQANVGAARARYNGLTMSAPPENPPVAPKEYALHEASPNPFNPITSFSYELRTAGYTSLKVYDMTGRLVTTLVDGWREAGTHQVTLDGSNLTSGLYFVRMQAGNFTQTQKVALIK